MNLQQQVQQHLQNTGISLRELSRRSGVSHTTIGKILRGGEYKSGTAHALYSLISITPISEYVTLHDKVEQLAAERVDHDKGWDVDLNCAKYRRVMALEKELGDAQDKLEYMKRLAGEDGQKIRDRDSTILDLDARMDAAKAEIKRLTALSDTHGQSWKAACVQVEQLQKQLDHGQTAYNKLHSQLGATRTKYETQLEKANQKDIQREEFLTKVYATKTRQEAQIMRLRVYVWILIAALVFVLASGFMILRGAV